MSYYVSPLRADDIRQICLQNDLKITQTQWKLLESWVDFKPSISIEIGLNKFAEWYLDYYKN